jgi:hypothetical protein
MINSGSHPLPAPRRVGAKPSATTPIHPPQLPLRGPIRIVRRIANGELLGYSSSKSLRGQPGQALVLRVGRLSRRRPQGQSDLPAFGSVPLLEPTAGDDWKRVMNHDPHAQFDLVEAKRRGAAHSSVKAWTSSAECGVASQGPVSQVVSSMPPADGR